eukprot:TRINITY_DN8832_c0_g1_i2.p1 TRINITY_DN8832_c0_g1~~TRINITY_DN8832_c0_g1_i2.p1  ORF type:complete len:383 (-),score=68.49 TRINITY_DN8832_c0_g1_i2:120-1268(-)
MKGVVVGFSPRVAGACGNCLAPSVAAGADVTARAVARYSGWRDVVCSTRRFPRSSRSIVACGSPPPSTVTWPWARVPLSHRGWSVLTARPFSGDGKPAEETAAVAANADHDMTQNEAPGDEHRGVSSAESHVEAERPAGPQVLWRAPPLKKQFAAAEQSITLCAGLSAGGLGLALLGLAPFAASNPFMIALLLASLQVRLAHAWQIRQLRAHFRRHVTEIVETDGKLTVEFDGGLERSLEFEDPSQSGETRPPLAAVIRYGHPFVYIDRDIGEAVNGDEALEAALSSEKVIKTEILDITTFEDEPLLEAQKIVQKLSVLTIRDLDLLAARQGTVVGGTKRPVGLTPKASMKQMERSSKLFGIGMMSMGSVFFVGGRLMDDSP